MKSQIKKSIENEVVNKMHAANLGIQANQADESENALLQDHAPPP